MFQIILIINVFDDHDEECSSHWCTVSRKLDLPFAPFIGMQIQFPVERGWKLKNVSWDTEEKIFRCYAENLFMNPLNVDEVFDDWIEDFQSNGWQLHGPYNN